MRLIFTISLLLTCFSLNCFSQEVTKVVVVEKPVKYVFRVVLESLNKCVVPGITWLQYSGAYYDDNDTASIFSPIESKGFGDSYKFKKIDNTHTEISYFKSRALLTTASGAEATLNKTLKWIEDGDRDCQFVDSPSNQTIIK